MSSLINPVPKLGQFRDYTLIVDRSASMSRIDPGERDTRWMRVAEGTFSVAKKVMRLDPDGIDLYLFDSVYEHYRNVDAAHVRQIFQKQGPSDGHTNLGSVLREAFNKYFAKPGTERRPETIIIISDGAPYLRKHHWPRSECLRPWYQRYAEYRAVKHLEKAFERVDSKDLNVLFLQIGNSEAATHFFNKVNKRFPDHVHSLVFEELEERGFKKILADVIAI